MRKGNKDSMILSPNIYHKKDKSMALDVFDDISRPCACVPTFMLLDLHAAAHKAQHEAFAPHLSSNQHSWVMRQI